MRSSVWITVNEMKFIKMTGKKSIKINFKFIGKLKLKKARQARFFISRAGGLQF